jgi:hypothetical protein
MENLAGGPFCMRLRSEPEQFFSMDALTQFHHQIRLALYRLEACCPDIARDAFARIEDKHAKEEI